MNSANLRDCHDATIVRRGDRAMDRRLLVQRQVRPSVFEIRIRQGTAGESWFAVCNFSARVLLVRQGP
jgi:hypothetical protein